jgi:hypothetical protein
MVLWAERRIDCHSFVVVVVVVVYVGRQHVTFRGKQMDRRLIDRHLAEMDSLSF